jgi:hypothetical protein
MPGPLSSERPVGEGTLTGGPDTSVSREINQDFKQVMRTKHMDRPARTGTFGVNTSSPMARGLNQKKTGMLSNLRTKANFKRRRLRK